MFELPEKWKIKANNDKECIAINKYVNTIIDEPDNYWKGKDSLIWYLLVEDSVYSGGDRNIEDQFTEITFEQFERYVLMKPSTIESQDYSYLIQLLENLNIK